MLTFPAFQGGNETTLSSTFVQLP